MVAGCHMMLGSTAKPGNAKHTWKTFRPSKVMFWPNQPKIRT